MNQVVTFTKLAHQGKSGTSKRGAYSFRVFETAGGVKFQTLSVEIGDSILGTLGTAYEVEYEVETNGDFTNNVIKSISPASEAQAAQAEAVPVNDRDQKQRSKEEVRRTESVKAAAVLLVELSKSEDSPVEATLSGLFELADTIAAYVETGQS